MGMFVFIATVYEFTALRRVAKSPPLRNSHLHHGHKNNGFVLEKHAESQAVHHTVPPAMIVGTGLAGADVDQLNGSGHKRKMEVAAAADEGHKVKVGKCDNYK